jgi:hypothetical protein
MVDRSLPPLLSGRKKYRYPIVSRRGLRGRTVMTYGSLGPGETVHGHSETRPCPSCGELCARVDHEVRAGSEKFQRVMTVVAVAGSLFVFFVLLGPALGGYKGWTVGQVAGVAVSMLLALTSAMWAAAPARFSKNRFGWYTRTWRGWGSLIGAAAGYVLLAIQLVELFTQTAVQSG